MKNTVRRLFRQKNGWILLGALGIVLCFLLLQQVMGPGAPSGTVRIYVQGQLYAEEALSALPRDITITQEDGVSNTLHLTADGFFMAHSTCHNQLCVQQGAVTTQNYFARALGNRIICLPNQVVAELTLQDHTLPPDAPDI